MENHWKTTKGKQTLYNVFSALVELENSRKESMMPITFSNITLRVSKYGVYKNAYVVHALKELQRLGFVKIGKYMQFAITPKGWEFWSIRKKLRRGEPCAK